MKNHLVHLIALAGGLLIMAGIAGDGWTVQDTTLRTLGLLGVLVGYTEWRMGRIPHKTAVYELGRQDGHREGYEEGRRARLNVVPLPAPCPRCQDAAAGTGAAVETG